MNTWCLEITADSFWSLGSFQLVHTDDLDKFCILRSDNGPCYSFKEFYHFLYITKHITSRPHYTALDSLKLWKSRPRRENHGTFSWLRYITTQISGNISSPLEVLTGRKPWIFLPQLPSSKGRSIEMSRICEELMLRQKKEDKISQHFHELELMMNSTMKRVNPRLHVGSWHFRTKQTIQ